MHIPQPGDIYMFTGRIKTAGNVEYEKGDLFTLIEQTDKAPFGYKSKISNWSVKCKAGTSVWASIWTLIESGGAICVGSNIV